MFSYSILADCCNSIELEDCKTELLQNDQCDDSQPAPESQEICQCSFSCSPKILIKQDHTFKNNSFSLAPEFPRYSDHFKNLDPLPVLQPPIA